MKPFKGTCRYCGKEIVWAETLGKDGKVHRKPYDLHASQNGPWLLFHPKGDTSKLRARWLGKSTEWPLGSLPRYGHFLTCKKQPDRDRYSDKPSSRKPRSAGVS